MVLVYHLKSYLFLSSSYSCRQNAYLKQFYNIVNLGENLLKLFMKKFFILVIFLVFSSAYAGGHITNEQKKETIKCLGHYSATAVLPADTIEVTDMEMALASVKVIRSFLQKEEVSDDEMNKGMNEHVDKVYGKPFNKSMNDKCNKFIYKLIPGSKEEIEKLSRTIYAG